MYRSHSCIVLAVCVGSLSSLSKALLPNLLLSLASSRSLGGSKLLPFKNDGGHCVLGDLQWCRHFLVHFPRSVPQHNPVSELYRQFHRPHGLVFALTCTVNCVGPFIYGCVSFQIMSNQLNLPQVDSNQVVEMSQERSMETGYT